MRHLAIVLLTLSLAPVVAAADSIRTWTDAEGVVHFTNVRPKRAAPAKIVEQKDGSMRISLEGIEADEGERKAYTPREVSSFDRHLREACDRYRIPTSLARAVLAAESNFRPEVISHAGAVGLMQLMPATAVEMYVDDLTNPRENIHGGVRYLRVLANEFDGDIVKMVAAYNAGPAAVKRAGGVPNIAETQQYVERVLELYKKYKAEGR